MAKVAQPYAKMKREKIWAGEFQGGTQEFFSGKGGGFVCVVM